MTDEFLKQYDRLSTEVFADAIRGSRDQNVVLSPLSIFILLEMLAVSSAGETKKEIAAVLSGQDGTADQAKALSELTNALGDEQAIRVANAVFASESYAGSVKADYVKMIRETFDGEVLSGPDFISLVNEWVNRKTEGMIPSILDESDSDLVIGLADAIYFDSEWENPYEDEDTSKGKFHNADRTVSDVTYLNSREHSYIENGFFTGFTKRYKGGFDFMALLPKKTGRHFIEGMLDDIDLMKLYRSAEFGIVKASIPEFKYGFSEELTQFCKKRGIEKAFTQEADFTPMTDKPAWLSTIIHKAEIEVNQAGTRTAAVTFGGMVGSLPDFDQKIHVVKLNRPFIYAIVHRDTGIPVFAGMVNRL